MGAPLGGRSWLCDPPDNWACAGLVNSAVPSNTQGNSLVSKGCEVMVFFFADYCSTNSTRRFLARPVSSRLLATGARLATPLPVRRSRVMP